MSHVLIAKRHEYGFRNVQNNFYYYITATGIVLTDRTRWQQQLSGGVCAAVGVSRDTHVRVRVFRSAVVVLTRFYL